MDVWNNEVHEVADMFPMLDDDRLRELADDIKANGLREAIWLDSDGKLLDGRNRLRACSMAGVAPTFQTYTGDDPIAFIVSLNIHRRHLNENERAFLALKLIPQYAKEGESRRLRGIRAANLERSKGVKRERAKDNPENWSTSKAGKALSVSRGLVTHARRVEKFAPDLVDSVISGDLSMNSAVKEVKRRADPSSAKEAVSSWVPPRMFSAIKDAASFADQTIAEFFREAIVNELARRNFWPPRRD